MGSFDLGLAVISHQFNGFVSVPHARKFADNSEHEIKYKAPFGTDTFSGILRHLPVLEFARTQGASVAEPVSDVFLLSPQYHYKDYYLCNFGLDTVTPSGDVSFMVLRHGLQFRSRMSFRPHLEDSHEHVFGTNQCTVKNIFSASSSLRRLEIEGKTADIAHGPEAFVKARKDVLPGFFSKLTPELDSFRVYSGFITSRGSYLMGVYLREEKMIVAFEANNDEILDFTPHLEPLTRIDSTQRQPEIIKNYEWEAEGKAIFPLRGRQVATALSHMGDNDMEHLFTKASVVMRDYFKRRTGMSLQAYSHSKQERSMEAIARHYQSEYTPNVASAFRQASVRDRLRFPEALPLSPNVVSPGLAFALQQNVGLDHVTHRKSALRELVKHMTSSYNLAVAPGIEKVPYTPEHQDEPEFQAKAKGSSSHTGHRSRKIA